jgi:hypothetical protein
MAREQECEPERNQKGRIVRKKVIQPNILMCIGEVFGGFSPLRRYTIFVSLSKENMCVFSQESGRPQGLVFWGIQSLRQYK